MSALYSQVISAGSRFVFPNPFWTMQKCPYTCAVGFFDCGWCSTDCTPPDCTACTRGNCRSDDYVANVRPRSDEGSSPKPDSRLWPACVPCDEPPDRTFNLSAAFCPSGQNYYQCGLGAGPMGMSPQPDPFKTMNWNGQCKTDT